MSVFHPLVLSEPNDEQAVCGRAARQQRGAHTECGDPQAPCVRVDQYHEGERQELRLLHQRPADQMQTAKGYPALSSRQRLQRSANPEQRAAARQLHRDNRIVQRGQSGGKRQRDISD